MQTLCSREMAIQAQAPSFAHLPLFIALLLALAFFTVFRTAAGDTDIDRANRELAETLEPRAYFRFFAETAGIPRALGDYRAIGDYLEAFARARNLECERYPSGNVIIRKKAQGTGSATWVTLQVHQDMVANKTPDSPHDFTRDPIKLVLDGDWLRADRTTLGADNGAGLATVLAILDSRDIVHPSLEVVFTVDEETTMSGAFAVDADQLRGDVLINIDSEEYGLAYVSSAAGVTSTMVIPLTRAPGASGLNLRLTVGGLKGGHSGVEINQGRANAFVLLARILADANGRGIGAGLRSFDSGPVPTAHNAIPSRAEAVLSLETERAAAELKALAGEWDAILRNEFRAADPGVRVVVEHADGDFPAPLDSDSLERLLGAIRLAPIGVIRFAQDEEMAEKPYGELFVETSNNLGVVRLGDDKVEIVELTRGSVRSALDDVVGRLDALAKAAGGELREDNRFPGWEMAHPRGRVQRLFEGRGWKMVGVHAGLECGVFVETLRAAGRKLDVISVGPDIVGGHTPEEKLRIGSVQAFWSDLLAVLEEL